jgi:TrmH family RNA methyltransferase
MKPRVVRIFSENNAFQHIETLRRNREKRHRQRAFFLEGVRPINQALAHGWTINALVYSRERRLSDWAADILARSAAATHYELPLHLMRKLSQKTETSELLAVVAMPPDDLARIPVDDKLLLVVFDRPASPGNLGTIIRSCDALGARGLVITGHAVDLYDPDTISATTGSLFALPVVRLPSHKDLLPWLERVRAALGKVQVVGTSEKAETDLAAHDFRQPTILAVGNETWGLSAAYTALCAALVRIPMVGVATSLNVACATAIALYEVDRQRRRAYQGDGTPTGE